ncbi:TrkA C-terminal domain-containing protein [Flavobacterium ginsengisoli]|uniref:TrkA C-terminal domain-containing protein n=1 Tax=Flavobacterium ginsengisoli TaxID=871694 RepID=UPI00241588FA|nr:TrkA C-terminal domain-containing protein [Flavobacterium ginsengisoli]
MLAIEAELESKGRHLFIERIRKGKDIFEAEKDTIVEENDVIALGGRREFMMNYVAVNEKEVLDVELLNFPVEVLTVMIVKKEVLNKTIGELRGSKIAHGVVIRSLKRAGIDMPVLPNTTFNKGDLIELVGTKKDVDRADIAYRLCRSGNKCNRYGICWIRNCLGRLVWRAYFKNQWCSN